MRNEIGSSGCLTLKDFNKSSKISYTFSLLRYD